MTRPIQPEELLAHAGWIRRLALSLVGSGAADDLVQETLQAGLAHPPAAGRPLRPWLARVLTNLARMRLRAQRRRARHEAAAPAASEVPSPETLVERVETQRMLAALVLALDEPCRSTILLRYYEDLSAAEIARRQGVPAGTVRWRLKQALDRLRAQLDARHGGNRRAWAIALAPLAKGALVMKKLALIAGVVIALAGGLWGGRALLERRGRTPQPAAPPHAGPLRAWALEPGAPTGAIEGTVRGPDGKPLAGARVAATLELAERPVGGAVSARGGHYRIEGLRSGPYGLSATAAGLAPGFRDGVTLLPGETLVGLDLTLARGGVTLGGRVLDTGGGAVAHAEIRARPAGDRRVAAVLAGADGAYRITLAPGKYLVSADADDYAPEAAELELGDDALHDFRLNPAAQIAGRVIERASGRPVEGATVRLELTGWWFEPRETPSDAAGRFAFARLDAGRYLLSARKGMLAGAVSRHVQVASAATATDVVIEVDRGYSIAGHVRSTHGTAAAKAEITVHRAEDLARTGDWVGARSSADGAYRIEGLLPGSLELTATAEKRVLARRQIALAKADLERIDFVLPDGASVLGKVVRKDGSPVGGAIVMGMIRTAPSDPWPGWGGYVRDRSQDDGSFRLDGLAHGELRLEATREGEHAALGPLPLGEGERKQVTLTIGQDATVAGVVRWDDGAQAGGVTVRGFNLMMGAMPRNAATSADGHYEIGPFEPGAVAIFPLRDAKTRGPFPPNRRTLALAPDEHRTGVDLVLARADQKISGLVVGPDGRPFAGATVGAALEINDRNPRLTDKAPAGNEATSAGDGSFTIENVERGRFTVWATHPGFPEAQVHRVPAGASGVRVQLRPEAALAGVVVRADGRPVADYTIGVLLGALPGESADRALMRRWGGPFCVKQTVHDRSGAFELRALEGEVYDLVATTAEGATGMTRGIALASGEHKRGLRVVIETGATLRGRVVELGTETPIPGAEVSLQLPQPLGATSDRAGSFAIDNVPVGPRRAAVGVRRDRSLCTRRPAGGNANQARGRDQAGARQPAAAGGSARQRGLRGR